MNSERTMTLRHWKPNYSHGEVKWLVEEYDELKSHKGLHGGRLLLLLKLSDLSIGLRRLSQKEAEAVLLCGMLAISTRSAGKILGVSATTMNNRYRYGLQHLVKTMNGSS